MNRRWYLRRAGAGAAALAGLAGCAGRGGRTDTAAGDGAGDGDASETATGTDADTGVATGTTATPSGTLTVATYASFTGEGTAGAYLKSAFEAEYPDVTVEFTTPDSGVNQYIQRATRGAPIDADVYVGLNTGELVRVDERLDEPLFATVADRIDGYESTKPSLRVDPRGRAIPYDTGYIAVVYDEDEVDPPAGFDALLEPAYRDALITQNAQQSDPGRAFLLWSILATGVDEYLDYWAALVDNGVTVLSDWQPAYQAYLNGEAPMVVSYSTDQVYYHGPDVDMSRHQVAFLNDQGYANPETMAQFAASDSPELARRFMEFVLTPAAQAEVAVRNVQFPAVEGVDPGAEFSQYALEPPEPVTFTYDELAGNVSGWIDRWARQVATR
jgi:thiamine transport system substrate-binding protein